MKGFLGNFITLNESLVLEPLLSHGVASWDDMGLDAKKNCLRGFENNKGTDQPAHPRRLTSAFVIRLSKVSYLDLQRAKFQFSSNSVCVAK